MKIRHKQSGVELEGEFEVTDTDFTEKSDGRWQTMSCYSTAQWEEVKPKWVDVTAECEVSDYRDAAGERMLSLYHPRTGQNTLHAANGYRLRKVRVAIKDESDPYGKYCDGDFHAFIIEQRQA